MPIERRANAAVSGNTRVTAITSRILRIEYADDAGFEDRPSLAVCHRSAAHLPPSRHRPAQSGAANAAADFTLRELGNVGGFELDTGAIALEVSRPAELPTRRSLRARLAQASDSEWYYGKKDRGNLLGTRRTLDAWKGDKRRKVALDDGGRLVPGRWQRQRLDPGLLSRDGWTVFDDSRSPVLASGITDRGPWPVPRPEQHRLDLYLFAHGRDYLGALREAKAVFGETPLLPRALLGYWYSRYFAYTDRDLEHLVDQFDQLGLPLDVLVIDMDWHLPGWTGYSWDPRYFPDPPRTLSHLHDRGLLVSLNVHPAEGVGRHEHAFVAMCEDLGLDPRTTRRIPFDGTDPGFVDSYFERLHHPKEEIGVDFWWIDWQQGKRSGLTGLDPLPWLNQLHWNDQVRRDPARRPVSFSRWGGLGSGRHPVGFSGDTYATWESLAFQPHFTATAANVLYGAWSHDIGGHYGPPTTPELMTRWIQFGCFSPILRTHGSKDTEQERRVWQFPSPHREQMMRDLRRRYEWIPYVYGALRSGHDDGRALVRPLYHEHPGLDGAYTHPGQYWFGPDVIVNPVTTPLEGDEAVAVTTWLPPGAWYDLALGERHRIRSRAGREVTRRYRLEETPVFARAGAILPGQRDARRAAASCYERLSFSIVPGAATNGELVGSAAVYEDDGVSEAWRKDASVTTPAHWKQTESGCVVTIGPASGRYRGWRGKRSVELRLLGTAPPSRVRVGRRMLTAGNGPGDDRWWWCPEQASTNIRLAQIDLRETTRLRIERHPQRSDVATDGLPGLARRLDRVAALCGLASPTTPLHPHERLAVDLAQTAHRIALEPERFARELGRLRLELRGLPRVLREFAQAWRASKRAPREQREAAAALLAQAVACLGSARKSPARQA